MINSNKLWSRHDEVIVLVELIVKTWLLNVLFSELGHPSSLIRVAISLNFDSILAPGVDERSPEKISVRYIDNTHLDTVAGEALFKFSTSKVIFVVSDIGIL
jgi:hypothetical protein